jgi:hypothetical protein
MSWRVISAIISIGSGWGIYIESIHSVMLEGIVKQ